MQVSTHAATFRARSRATRRVQASAVGVPFVGQVSEIVVAGAGAVLVLALVLLVKMNSGGPARTQHSGQQAPEQYIFR